MDHPLSAARQRAVVAIATQKQHIVEQANKAIRELDESLADLAATYASAAGLKGEWCFVQVETGEIALRKASTPPEQSLPPRGRDGDSIGGHAPNDVAAQVAQPDFADVSADGGGREGE